MSFIDELGTTWAPRAQGLLRIVTGFLFLQHSTAKLFGVPHVAYFDNLLSDPREADKLVWKMPQ